MRSLGILLFLVLLSVRSWGQESSEYRLKAAFIERFTRFVTWPADKPLRDPVIVGIVGDGKIFVEMKAFFQDVKIQNRRVEVRNVLASSSLSDFDILMISCSGSAASDLHKRLPSKPILTIGDSPALIASGMMFSFSLVNGKLKFSVNSSEVEKAGLKVSSILLNSAASGQAAVK